MIPDARLEDLLKTGGKAGPYVKTHSFAGPYINAAHEALGTAPLLEGTPKIAHPIRGSLRRGDAAKIYELAFFAGGPVADLGTNCGLSSAIAAQALVDAGTSFGVETVDLEPRMTKRALRSYRENGIGNVTAHTAEAAAWLDGQIAAHRRFSFVFVDHSHHYEHVRSVCERLHAVTAPGAYIAFHDFVDGRNADPNVPNFGVVQGAVDGLSDAFAYIGASGCTGVFRYAG